MSIDGKTKLQSLRRENNKGGTFFAIYFQWLPCQNSQSSERSKDSGKVPITTIDFQKNKWAIATLDVLLSSPQDKKGENSLGCLTQ